MHIRQVRKIRSILALQFLLLLSGVDLFAQDCSARVEILSNKSDAIILVDSLSAGKGRVDFKLSKGNHLLLIKENSLKWGEPVILDTLRITDCEKKYLFTYELNKAVPSFNKNFAEGNGFEKKNDDFFESGTFKLLLGGAVVLGGVAAYFKLQADNKYEDYLLSKNQSALDEVNKLDLYSGISFGLLQINFGYLIYKFLTD